MESFLEYDGFHDIFSDLQREIKALTFRINGNVNRRLSVQGYLEIYSNHDLYDQSTYSEYNVNGEYFDPLTDYILGTGEFWEDMPVYTDDESQLDASYLDPYLFLGLYPKYTSMILNGIVKWNYMKGSNIYFVYSYNKSVNGFIFCASPHDGIL